MRPVTLSERSLLLALAALPAGRRLGVDQWLVLRLETQTSRVARVLRWFI
jgi:hypothetical protein